MHQEKLSDRLELRKYRRRKKNSVFTRLKKFKTFFIVATIVVVLAIVWSFLSSTSAVFNFAFGSGARLKSTDNMVNVLLLGIGGEGHDGPYLTDSIIVASYNLKTKKVTLISIPRDLWLDGPRVKVNEVYQQGLGKGKGLSYAEDKIDDILGVPIHYGIRLDFSGFSKAIDLVGGVEVNVERTFDDYEYPLDGKENDLCDYQEKVVTLTDDQIKALNLPPTQTDFKANVSKKVLVDPAGKIATDSATLSFPCRFEHIHFDQGLTHMNGETALKFVRSRHAFGPEGSDFARSKRQQLVIQAFREKLLTFQTLANPGKISSLISTFGKSVDTDIPASTYLEFYSLFKKVSSTDNIILGDLGDGKSLLINPPPSDYGGSWVLTPPNNDFSLIQKFLKDKLTGVTVSPTPSASQN